MSDEVSVTIGEKAVLAHCYDSFLKREISNYHSNLKLDMFHNAVG